MNAAETAPTTQRDPSDHGKSTRRRRRLLLCLSLSASSGALLASTAFGQDAPPVLQVPPPAPTAPLPPPPPAPAPAYTTPPVVGSPAAPQPEISAVAPAEQPALASPQPVEPAPTPPAPVEKDGPLTLAPKLKVGIGVRTGLSLSVNNPSDDVQFTLSDGLADELLIRPYFSGQLTENIGVVANFEFGTGGGGGIGLAVLDAIAQVKIVDEFQVWIGQHIPANDRINFQGPFYHNSWNFEGAVPAFPFDRGARDRGFTFWGLVAGGVLKYHLSMVDLQPGQSIENARFAARATINLLDPENYYYTQGTYYGAQDTLAIGGVVNYQKGTGIVTATDDAPELRADNDFLGGSVDLLAEKNFGAAGTFTLQAVYWNFKGTDAAYAVNQGTKDVGSGFPGPYAVDQAVLAEVTWLAPSKVGIGQLQPGFHVQWADNRAAGEDKIYDVSLGYIVDGFNHKWYLNYRHLDSDARGKDDSFQLGAQMQI